MQSQREEIATAATRIERAEEARTKLQAQLNDAVKEIARLKYAPRPLLLS